MKTKKGFVKAVVCCMLSLSLLSTLALPVFAHNLSSWANCYTDAKANSTYSFSIMNAAHIDGKNVKYCWANNTAKTKLSKYMSPAFSSGWRGIISGTETTSANAHVTISYDPIATPDDTAAETKLNGCDSNQHIRLGYGDAIITVYYDVFIGDFNEVKRQQVMVHELGHLWGIDDLYQKYENLESIYSKLYVYTQATRHDMNALRIGLNNLWFNPGTGGVWKYQESPGVFYDRGDVDKNHAVQAADARLVLRVTSNLESISGVQQRIADVDGVDGVTANDARLIMQYVSGQISRFPLDDNRV